MGFLDRLLGRSKKALDTAEEKLGMHDHGDAGETAPPATTAPPPPGSAPETAAPPEGESGENA